MRAENVRYVRSNIERLTFDIHKIHPNRRGHKYNKITDSATNLRPTEFASAWPISDAIFPLPVQI